MGFARRCVTSCVAVFAVVGVIAALGAGLGAASASAYSFTLPNWAVWGTLTDKKLNETITLPKGSTFNGGVTVTKLTPSEMEGTVQGKLYVPPFKASLKLAGLVPIEVGITLTEAGESQGTLSPAPANTPACVQSSYTGLCEETKVVSRAIIGITGTGLGGLELPAECQTSEPVTLELRTISTLGEVFSFGAHFTGDTTIPSISCGGIDGLVLGPAITLLMSGPENPYSLHLADGEPAKPAVESPRTLNVSQISARLGARINPEHEPLTECRFEYGTSTSYGSSVPCYSLPHEEHLERTALTGLAEGATYDWRIVAANSLGTTEGPNQTFTTLGSAGEPEYGQCVAQKGGEYAESNCTEKAKRAGHGYYEWKPGPAPTCVAKKKGDYTDQNCQTLARKPGKGTFETAPGPGFTATTTEGITLGTPELGASVTCTAGTAVGGVTSTDTATERITFTGCEQEGHKCTSEGANSNASGTPGTVITNQLAGRLLGPVEGKVWSELESTEHAPYVSEFGCGGSRYRTSGSAAGLQSENVLTMSTTGLTAFEAERGGEVEGEQALSTALSLDGGKTFGEADPSTLVAKFSTTTASPIEIRR